MPRVHDQMRVQPPHTQGSAISGKCWPVNPRPACWQMFRCWWLLPACWIPLCNC